MSKELFTGGLKVETKRALIGAILFILRNPSKYSQTENDKCVIGIALRLMGLDINKLDGRESAVALGLTSEQYFYIYVNDFVGDKWRFFQTIKQDRTRALLATKRILELVTADGAKDATTAFAHVALELLNGSKDYNQMSSETCLWGKVKKYLGSIENHFVLARIIGVNGKTASRSFCATASEWPKAQALALRNSKQRRTKLRAAATLALMIAELPSAELPPPPTSQDLYGY